MLSINYANFLSAGADEEDLKTYEPHILAEFFAEKAKLLIFTDKSMLLMLSTGLAAATDCDHLECVARFLHETVSPVAPEIVEAFLANLKEIFLND